MIADRSQVEELAREIATFEVDRDEQERAEGRAARVGKMVGGVFVETVRTRDEMIAAYSTDEDVTLKLAERLLALGYQRITPDSIVVPREPTEEMLKAAVGDDFLTDEQESSFVWRAKYYYRAMLAATSPSREGEK